MGYYVIDFPAPTPPVSINKTRRAHWGAVHRQLKPWRDAAHARAVALQATNSMPEGLKLSEVTVYLPFKTNRRRDPHNYTGTNVKAVVDGLVTAGVWKDDNPRFVRVMEPVLVVTDKPTVFVEIEEV